VTANGESCCRQVRVRIPVTRKGGLEAGEVGLDPVEDDLWSDPEIFESDEEFGFLAEGTKKS